jgi:hypothetical protein
MILTSGERDVERMRERAVQGSLLEVRAEPSTSAMPLVMRISVASSPRRGRLQAVCLLLAMRPSSLRQQIFRDHAFDVTFSERRDREQRIGADADRDE